MPPISRMRLTSTASFQAGRTIGVAVPRCAACNCETRSGSSFGECSVSSTSQSKPLSDNISTAMLLHRLHHKPICNFPSRSARLNGLRWNSTIALSSNELNGDAAEAAEIGMHGVALLREHHAGERAGEHKVPRLERGADLAQFVGEPGDAKRRMAEHAGGKPGLLDLGIAVHDAADPAQVDVERPDRAAAERDAGGGAIVGHRVADLALILDARIDDLDRRDDIFGGAQDFGEADTGPEQALAHDEAKLNLDARL